MFVAEVLENEMQRWKAGDDVLIQAPTGAGKTTFILHTLLPYALTHSREILYLSNRQILHRQILQECCKMYDIPYEYMQEEKMAEFKGITLMTYQTLQELLTEKCNIYQVRFFYYVVADEVHYLAEDSAFNAKIKRVVKWFSLLSQRVFIAISATLEPALPYLPISNGGYLEYWEEEYCNVRSRKPRDIMNGLSGIREYIYFYHVPGEPQNYKIYVYESVEEVVEKINADESKKKWLIFQSSKEKANKKIKTQIDKPVSMITAADKDSKTMREIVEQQKYSAQVLLTTKVLDNGVSLHDPFIQNIVLDTISKTEFLQMLGRKRRQAENELVNLYIPQMSVRFFENVLRTSVIPAIELIRKPLNILLAEIFDSEDVYSECKKYFDVKNGEMVLNPIAKKELEKKREYCENMIQKLKTDEFAFVREQLGWLEAEEMFENLIFLSEQREKSALDKLTEFLEGAEGEVMGKERQTWFRNEITSILKILFANEIERSDRVMGLKLINEYLGKLELPIKIQSVSGKRRGEETVWKIIKA